MKERRAEKRKECEIPIFVQGPSEDGSFFEQSGVVKNFSDSGALLNLKKKIKKGALIIISAKYHDFESTARVSSVWQDEKEGDIKMGVQFLNPDENWIKKIALE